MYSNIMRSAVRTRRNILGVGTSSDDEGAISDECDEGNYNFLHKANRLLKETLGNQYYRPTPLHKAVLNGSSKQVLELLQQGVDVNVLDEYNRTPLYCAMRPNRLEIACMLLYYGADVLITDNLNYTPFEFAYKQYERIFDSKPKDIVDTHSVASVLFDYFDESFLKSADGTKIFLTAIKNNSPIALDLLVAGVKVNSSDSDFVDQWNDALWNNLLYYTLKYTSDKLFKLVWPQLDYNTLIVEHMYAYPVPGFLSCFLRECSFPPQGWLECLYLLLNSTVAKDLVQDCMKYGPDRSGHYFIQTLLYAFERKNITQHDRTNIIYICLSLGADINYIEFRFVFQMHGFGDELEALLYNVECYKDINKSREPFLLLPMCILGCDIDNNQKYILQLYEQEIEGYLIAWPTYDYDDKHELELNSLLNTLGYFALTESTKRKLRLIAEMYLPQPEEVCLKLNNIPAMPSLTEMCRTTFRRHLKTTYKFKYPYQFHDAIKRLKIPEQIKDVIRFKRPVYF